MATKYVRRGRGRPREERTICVLEDMPGSRVRVSPLIVPDLVCWIYALRARWDRVARMTLSGYKGSERERRKAQIESARRRCAVYDEVLASMHESVDSCALADARRQWCEGLDTADAKE